MAGRYEQLDSDEQRLPEGMTRVGYDADSQQYTYRDADGSYWYGEEGNRYGRLHQSAEVARQSGFNGEGVPAHIRHADYAAMAPWFLIVIVTLMVVFWYVNSGGHFSVKCAEGLQKYTISKGDTCWSIAKEHGTTVDALALANPKMSCNNLLPAQMICLPA